MRILALVVTAVLSLSAGGCYLDPNAPSVFSGGTSVTARITSPVGPVDIYRAKTVYASALEVMRGYRRYCWARPYAIILNDPVAEPICRDRRRNVRVAQGAAIRAKAAILTAEQFIRNNPTLSAVSAVQAAWAAVTVFQNAVNESAVAIAAAR